MNEKSIHIQFPTVSVPNNQKYSHPHRFIHNKQNKEEKKYM